MYIVTVEFAVRPEHATRFRAAMVANARASRQVEAGCRQFDVCAMPDDPAKLFLYEAYADRAAFDAHLASAHYCAFDAAVRDWVAEKTVRIYQRLDP